MSRKPSAQQVRLGAVLAVALVAYLATRAALLQRFPWFVDEANFGFYTQMTLGDRGSRFIALMDHKGLLNAWIGAGLMRFGAEPIEALRLIAGGSGVLTALATGLIVRRWLGAAQGVAAAVLVLFVPWLFIQNAVGVHDSLVAALSMVAFAMHLSLARRLRLDTALLLGFVTGALFLTKPTGMIVVALLPASLLVFDWQGPGRARRLLRWMWLAAVSVVVGVVMYSVTRLSPLAYGPVPDNTRSLSEFTHDPFGALSVVGGDAMNGMIGSLTVPIVIAALWGIWRAARTRDAVGLMLTIWSGVAIAAFLLLTERGFPRYGIQAAAPLCALAVLGACDLLGRLQARRTQLIAAGVVAVALIPAVVLDARVLANPHDAPYPGLDRSQYVTADSNVEPERAAAQRMLELTPAELPKDYHEYDTTILVNTGWDWPLILSLNGRTYNPHPRFAVFKPWTATPEQANLFRFVVTASGTANPDWLDLSKAKVVGRWKRPGGGTVTTLYDRGTIASRGLL